MDIDVWYDAVATSGIDFDSAGAEWDMVPVITKALLEEESTWVLFIGDAIAGQETHLARTACCYSDCVENRLDVALAMYAGDLAGTIRTAMNTEVHNYVTKNAADFLSQFLNYRAELAESREINLQITAMREAS